MTQLSNKKITRCVYCYIRACIEQNHLPPTQREIGEACYISSGTVSRHLDRLVILGYIERIEGTTRGIKLTERLPQDCQKIRM